VIVSIHRTVYTYYAPSLTSLQSDRLFSILARPRLYEESVEGYLCWADNDTDAGNMPIVVISAGDLFKPGK
jgi:hypothetical protein